MGFLALERQVLASPPLPPATSMLRPSAPEPGGRAGTLLGGAQPSSRLSCQRAGLMFSISSGAPALVCPEAPSLPLLGTRRRAQPAWPPPGTRVDVEAPGLLHGPEPLPHLALHGGSGPSRQLQEPGGSGSFAGAEGVRQAVGRVLGPGRMVQLCREKRGGGQSSGDVLRRRPWGRGRLCSGSCFAGVHVHSCCSVLSRVRPFSLIDRQHARLPCPPLSPRVCPDSCPLMMPSRHLILCRSLLFLLVIFPSIRVFLNESALCIRWPKCWGFGFRISPSSEYSGLISSRMDWLDLLAVRGTLKSLLQHRDSKATILRHSAFFTVQLSRPYLTVENPQL